MFLEMFGKCETLTEQYKPKLKTKIERLSWTVLPQGEYPWEKAKSHLGVIISSIPRKHRNIISNRHEAITQYKPDFMAIGDQSFWGYVIYGFTNKNLYVFESNQLNNATYIFRGNWKDASRLSKAEIIGGQYHEDRIIHNKNWNNDISRLISA